MTRFGSAKKLQIHTYLHSTYMYLSHPCHAPTSATVTDTDTARARKKAADTSDYVGSRLADTRDLYIDTKQAHTHTYTGTLTHSQARTHTHTHDAIYLWPANQNGAPELQLLTYLYLAFASHRFCSCIFASLMYPVRRDWAIIRHMCN